MSSNLPGAVTEMFCQLRKLRFVTFGSAETVTWRSTHGRSGPYPTIVKGQCWVVKVHAVSTRASIALACEDHASQHFWVCPVGGMVGEPGRLMSLRGQVSVPVKGVRGDWLMASALALDTTDNFGVRLGNSSEQVAFLFSAIRSYAERLHPQSRLLDSEWVSSAEDAPAGVQGVIQLVRQRRCATPDAWVQEFLARTVMREQASMTIVVESLREAARADGIAALGANPAPAAVAAVPPDDACVTLLATVFTAIVNGTYNAGVAPPVIANVTAGAFPNADLYIARPGVSRDLLALWGIAVATAQTQVAI